MGDVLGAVKLDGNMTAKNVQIKDDGTTPSPKATKEVKKKDTLAQHSIDGKAVQKLKHSAPDPDQFHQVCFLLVLQKSDFLEIMF